MSDRRLATELEVRNVLAERIAAVLRQRQKIGAERRAHEREYERLNNDRALARHYRLTGKAQYLECEPNPQPKPANSSNSPELEDTHLMKNTLVEATTQAKPESLIVVRLRFQRELNRSTEPDVIKKPGY